MNIIAVVLIDDEYILVARDTDDSNFSVGSVYTMPVVQWQSLYTCRVRVVGSSGGATSSVASTSVVCCCLLDVGEENGG
jgi:hypothetical protein